MKFKKPCVNYLEFRPSKIWDDQFKHLLLLIYWPVFGILFAFVEKGYDRYLPALGKQFHYVHCTLDDIIPFNEFFVIPYLFWFLYIVLSLAYTLLYDLDSYKRTMTFIIITYTVAILCYFTYPTAQNLRPVVFERDNILTQFMQKFYAFDTNTNVCPSIHVCGSFASTFAFTQSKGVSKGVKISAHIINVLICLSTVFLKQHSAIDVIVALPICAAAYFFCYRCNVKTAKQSSKKRISATNV